METPSPRPQDIIDTTDSLEAISACKSMKNFLFLVILFCLLLTQVIFWLNKFDLIQCSGCRADTKCTLMKESSEISGCDNQSIPCAAAPLPLAATVNVAQEVEKVAGGIEQNLPAEAVVDKTIILEKETDNPTAETPADQVPVEPETKLQVDITALFKISCNVAKVVVAICNFFMLTASILYCLTLLICLKISLTGRLGGINHIARAFFISLLLLVILIPWQQVLPKVLVGTVWLPRELLCGGWAKSNCMTFWTVLFYIRFVGLWFVAMWFLLWAQIRSAKWSRTTLRRLGVVR